MNSPITSSEYLSEKNKYLHHILRYKTWYLLLILTLVLGTPLLTRYYNQEPLLQGGESYYHLYTAQSNPWKTSPYHSPLYYLHTYLPELILALIPPLMGIIVLALALILASRLEFPDDITFFGLLFTITSPAFIVAYTTFSAYNITIMLILLGFILLTQKQRWVSLFSLFPFFLTTFIDMVSSILQLTALLIFMNTHPEKKNHTRAAVGITILATIVTKILFNLPLALGPFHPQQRVADFISDLGGLSGISFFTLLIALAGAVIIWRKKQWHYAFLFLPILLTLYLYNTTSVLFLSIPFIFFAAVGFVHLVQRGWNFPTLKVFTILVLLLGLLFSTLSYLERATLLSPTTAEREALLWIQENTSNEWTVLSDPANSYYLLYFARRQPLQIPHEDNLVRQNLSQRAFQAFYIRDLFPVLEQARVRYILITPSMYVTLPKDQKLLFLLKNERFKMIYSHQGVEVWKFQPQD